MSIQNPATQEHLARVPLCSASEVGQAVASAKAAFPAWAATPVPQRARVMFKLHSLIQQHMDELSSCITREQGKTLADARGDIFRGLEVVEFAAGIAPFLQGNLLENVSAGIDTYSIRQPLGVTAGLCPFNFPAMSKLMKLCNMMFTSTTKIPRDVLSLSHLRPPNEDRHYDYEGRSLSNFRMY